jgi:hypothetical protein
VDTLRALTRKRALIAERPPSESRDVILKALDDVIAEREAATPR